MSRTTTVVSRELPAGRPSPARLGRSLVVIFLVALAIRVAFVLTLGPTLTWDDEREFAQVARHLAAGDGFVAPSYRANPVLPAYLAAVFRVFGESYTVARLGQALFGALTCVLVALTALRLAGPTVGVLSGLVLAVYLPHVYLSGVFYVECLFTLLIASTVYCAVRTLDGPLGWAIATGVAFGLTALTRSVFLAFMPFLCLALVVGAPASRRLRQVGLCTALGLATLAVILPWTARNYAAYGKPILVSSGFGTKLWQGNSEFAVGDADDREVYWWNPVGRARLAEMEPAERARVDARYAEVGRRVDALEAQLGDRYLASDTVLGPIAMAYIRANPGRTAELFAKKLVTLLSPFSKTISTNEHTSGRNRLIAALAYLPVLALAAVGAVLGLKRGGGLVILYALLGSIAAAYALLNTCTRFRLPLDPYLIVFAAIAVVELRSRVMARASSRVTRPALTRGTSSVALLFSLVALLALLLLGGAAVYHAYLASPDVPEPRPAPVARAPLARQLVMFIIDGFHPGLAWDPAVMPTFTRLAVEGASGIAKTSSMSLTAPCVFSLGTGRPGTLLQGILDFHAPETRVESLPGLMAATGRHVVLAGDQSWVLQFGWAARPEDQHPTEELGVGLKGVMRQSDRESAEFLLERIRDPAVGLAVVHLGTVDAAGHFLTPTGRGYPDVVNAMDGLLAHVVDGLAPDTLLLVTGDHGMGPRGTHSGRDDEATLTPYLLHGPGVKRGVRADIRQTAIPPTLAVLMGLPLPQASEYPPRTDLLDVDPAFAREVEGEYLTRKIAAAKSLAPRLADTADDALLNRILFGEGDRHVGERLLAALVILVGVLAGLALPWRSVPWPGLRPPFLAYAGLALVLPLGLALVAAAFISWRSLFPFQSGPTAAVLAVLAFAGVGAVGLAIRRSPRLTDHVDRWLAPGFFAVMVTLAAPLANSRWFRPQPVFEGLLLVLALGYALYARRRVGRVTRSVALVPAFVVLAHADVLLAALQTHDWLYVLPLSVAVLGLGLVAARGAGWITRAQVGAVLMASAFLAAWTWRVHGGVPTAWVVLALSLGTIAAAVWARAEARASGALMIGGATALFLMMAETGVESFIFLLAALGGLVFLLSGRRIPLERPAVLYAAAGLAILVRMCIFFQLGDQYSINSIRTAPGFRVVESGLPLPTVIALLLLKYALPWFLILGAALPSLVAVGGAVTRHVMHVVVLGYVARFAVVGALVDPFHVLPNGMEGLLSVFSISWAELVTFTAAASVAVLAAERSLPVDLAVEAAAPAVGEPALPEVRVGAALPS